MSLSPNRLYMYSRLTMVYMYRFQCKCDILKYLCILTSFWPLDDIWPQHPYGHSLSHTGQWLRPKLVLNLTWLCQNDSRFTKLNKNQNHRFAYKCLIRTYTHKEIVTARSQPRQKWYDVQGLGTATDTIKSITGWCIWKTGLRTVYLQLHFTIMTSSPVS